LFKFCIFWLTLSSILGSMSFVWQYLKFKKIVIDQSPKTRAWYDGPHLLPWMRATREIGSIILAFYPLSTEYHQLIESGIGYFNFCLVLSSLWGLILISELYRQGSRF
jgi:hypothetical protein